MATKKVKDPVKLAEMKLNKALPKGYKIVLSIPMAQFYSAKGGKPTHIHWCLSPHKARECFARWSSYQQDLVRGCKTVSFGGWASDGRRSASAKDAEPRRRQA
jgi:hypothetical protein